MARAYRLTDEGRLQLPGVDIPAGIPHASLELADNELFDTDSHPGRRAVLHRAARLVRGRPRHRGAHLAAAPRGPNYDPDAYVSETVTFPSPVPPTGGPGGIEQVDVPVTIVRRVDTPLDGTAACLLYGYGAYEACFEPEFDPALVSLLDRGVVFAHAHIRGGGEGGRRWWLDGRLEHKQNTFTDQIAVADGLAEGLVDGSRIVTRGLSAGGLLQGAVFSQAPDRWAAV